MDNMGFISQKYGKTIVMICHLATPALILGRESYRIYDESSKGLRVSRYYVPLWIWNRANC
jgi:hypothetical protein